MAKLSMDPTTSPQRSPSITTTITQSLAPLQEATADRVNRKISRQEDAPSILPDLDVRLHDFENVRTDGPLKTISLTTAQAQDVNERRRQQKAALERASLAREEAESESRKLKEELTAVKKDVDAGRAREMRLNERWENVVEELDATNERHKYAISRYEKEIRKFAKQQFQSSSALVKVQEELKATRTAFKSAQTENNAYRAKETASNDAEFRAQYKLISLQEEYDRTMGKLEKLQKRIRQSSGLADGIDTVEDGMMWDPVGQEEQEATKTSILRYNLSLAQQALLRSEETIEFMKMECRFQCCACRIEEDVRSDECEARPATKGEPEVDGISPAILDRPRGRSPRRRSSTFDLPAASRRSPSAPYQTAPSSIIDSEAEHSLVYSDQAGAVAAVDEPSFAPDDTPEPVNLDFDPPADSPTKTGLFNEDMTMIVPPSGMIFKSQHPGQIPTADDFAQILAEATMRALPQSPTEGAVLPHVLATPMRAVPRPLPEPPIRTRGFDGTVEEQALYDQAPLTGRSDTPLCSPPANAHATPFHAFGSSHTHTQTIRIPLRPADESSPSSTSPALNSVATPARALRARSRDSGAHDRRLLPGTPISREAALAQIAARRGRARSMHVGESPAKSGRAQSTRRDISAPEKGREKGMVGGAGGAGAGAGGNTGGGKVVKNGNGVIGRGPGNGRRLGS